MPSAMLTVEEALARNYYFIPWKPLTGSVAKRGAGAAAPYGCGYSLDPHRQFLC